MSEDTHSPYAQLSPEQRQTLLNMFRRALPDLIPPEPEPTEWTEPRLTFSKGSQYMTEPPSLLWLVEGFIPRGYLVVLGGTSKSGKSCLATALAMSVATGEPFLGMDVDQGPVLWLACEESYAERQDALQAWLPIPDQLLTSHDRIQIENPDDRDALVDCILKSKARLVVIDSLFAATGASLADGRSARDVLTRLKYIAESCLVTVLVLHHTNKDTAAGLNRDRFAESNQILAAASMDILFDSQPKDGYREIRLSSRGRGDWANRELRLRSESISHYELLASGEEDATTSDLRAEVLRQALATSEVPLTAEELAATCNVPLTTTRNRLTMMLKEGTVQTVGKRGKAYLFTLSQLPNFLPPYRDTECEEEENLPLLPACPERSRMGEKGAGGKRGTPTDPHDPHPLGTNESPHAPTTNTPTTNKPNNSHLNRRQRRALARRK